MSTINAEWHKANRMPAKASLDQRVAWHLAHWQACRCRSTLPGTIVEELKRRGVKLPAARPPAAGVQSPENIAKGRTRR